MRQYVLLPAIARRRYKGLLGMQQSFIEEAATSGFNSYIDGKDKKLGIITTGIAYNYLLENYEDRVVPHPVLKISQYPMPRKMVEKLVDSCEKILVLEEGYPVIEELLKGYLGRGIIVTGRLDGTVPRDGELNPAIVAKALGMHVDEAREIPEIVAARPPSLCPGCPHIDTYVAMNEALEKYGKGRVFADIGCYTLGALPPYNAINSCVDMGASVTMAKGAADAGLHPSVAVIGDSTFTHSGMTGLMDAVTDKTPITLFVLDNGTTAMTGGQNSAGTGRIDEICIGMGVDKAHIRELKPLKKNHDEMVRVISEELEYKGVSVIIAKRECIVELNKKMREKFKNK